MRQYYFFTFPRPSDKLLVANIYQEVNGIQFNNFQTWKVEGNPPKLSKMKREEDIRMKAFFEKLTTFDVITQARIINYLLEDFYVLSDDSWLTLKMDKYLSDTRLKIARGLIFQVVEHDTVQRSYINGDIISIDVTHLNTKDEDTFMNCMEEVKSVLDTVDFETEVVTNIKIVDGKVEFDIVKNVKV